MYMNANHYGNSGLQYEIPCTPTTYSQGFYNPACYQPVPVMYTDGIDKRDVANETLIIADTTNHLMMLAKAKSVIATNGWTAEKRYLSNREFQIAAYGTYEVLHVEKGVSNSGREVTSNVVFGIVTVTGERKNAKLPYNVHLDKKTLKNFFEENGKGCNAVLGISGGKDSSIVAALCVKALGKDRVIGVLMPKGEQFDINYSEELCDFLDIKRFTVNY